MEPNSLVNWCRICYTELNNGVNLFGEESRRLFLQAKIRRYLSFAISIDDKLPKMICTECCLKLDGFHKFATMALRNQEKMSKIISSNLNCVENNRENKSLLHTYLTKGIKEKTVISTEPEVTEMEVRVDPMMILECCMDDYEENSTENDHEEQISDKDDEEQSDQEELKLSNENSSETKNVKKKKKPYTCTLCPRSYTSEIALQNHMWGHPPYPKKILRFNNNNSDKQSESFNDNNIINSNNNINNNNNSDETEEDSDDEEVGNKDQKYSCPICGKVISTQGNLKVHLESHRPKGRYGCDICGRIFKTQCNLFRHKEYHGGVQYPCSVCGRVYPTNSTLRAHSITHSDLRPHECPMCEKTFKRNQDLKFHINQHTGARPYQCPYCPKAFASSGNCFSHRKRMHPVEVERDRERAAKIMR